MKLTCLNCTHEFDDTVSLDELGWHSVCPECESSFDVDLSKDEIGQLKLEAAIQFGRISALNQMHEDKDIEEIREIFEAHWKNFEQDMSWGYFADYYQDQVNQHKLYGGNEQ